MTDQFKTLYSEYKLHPTDKLRDELYEIAMVALEAIPESIINPFI